MKKSSFMPDTLIAVDDDRIQNRKSIRTEGEELRLKIKESRELEEDDGSADIKVLSLLQKIIAHDRKHGQSENIEVRKNTLFNIARAVTLLSDRADPDKPQKIKKKYISSSKRSIWRDIEFLHKMLLSQPEISYNNHFISDERVQKILKHDISILAKVIASELNTSLLKPKEQNIHILYHDTTRLHHIYGIVNFYREKESLQKILKYTDPVFLAQINPETLKGKLAVFRVLEVVGEFCTQKNLTTTTRNLVIDLDWNLLVAVRNSLVHHEWYLAYDNKMPDLLDCDIKAILEVDIPFIRKRIEFIFCNHQEIEAMGSRMVETRDFDEAVADWFIEHKKIVRLSGNTKQVIVQHYKWFLQNGFINEAQFSNVLDLIQQDLEAVTENLKTDLMNYSKKQKVTEKNIKHPELEELMEIIHGFNKIQGELTYIDKAKKKIDELLKDLVEIFVINNQDNETIQGIIKSTVNLGGLLALVMDIQKKHGFAVDETKVKILELYNKIKKKEEKQNNHVRSLYDLLVEKGLMKEAEFEEILEKNSSAQINKMLQMINSFVKGNNLESVDDKKIKISRRYHELIAYIRPNKYAKIKNYIVTYCNLLVKKQIITEANKEELTILLDNMKIQDFLSTLKKKIGEEKFTKQYINQIKNPETIQLEEMRKKFGEILSTVDEEKKSSKKAVKDLTKVKTQDTDQHLKHLRVFRRRLPDKDLYNRTKKKQVLLEQSNVLAGALFVINLLEQLFDELEFFAEIKEAFPKERQFIGIQQELWNRLQGGLYNDETYLEALKQLKANFKADMVFILLAEHLITNKDDAIICKQIVMEINEQEMKNYQDYILQNMDYIVRETINFVNFLYICDKLKTNPVLKCGIEYAISIIWPYLAQLQKEYLSGVPKEKLRELKIQRNVIKHGNIYADLLLSDILEKYLVRYASIFTKDLKPLLEQFFKSFSENKEHSYDVN